MVSLEQEEEALGKSMTLNTNIAEEVDMKVVAAAYVVKLISTTSKSSSSRPEL